MGLLDFLLQFFLDIFFEFFDFFALLEKFFFLGLELLLLCGSQIDLNLVLRDQIFQFFFFEHFWLKLRKIFLKSFVPNFGFFQIFCLNFLLGFFDFFIKNFQLIFPFIFL